MAVVSSSPKTPRSSREDFVECSPRLAVPPAELVIDILQYLPAADLRRAAGVSRQFYACVLSVGHHIHRYLNYGGTSHSEFAAWKDLVKHAVRKGLPLGLSFQAFINAHQHNHLPMADILSSVSTALPLLVHLSVELRGGDLTLATFCHPMPRLRDLDIMFTEDQNTDILSLPRDFLGGHAPRLQKLALSKVTLSTAALPAFANVTSVFFYFYGAPPTFSFATHFPRLSALVLRQDPLNASQQALSINLTGLALRSLAVDAHALPLIHRAAKLNDIPVVRCQEYDLSIRWLEPDAEEDPADFSLLVSGGLAADSTVSAVVVPAHRRWHRICDAYEWDRARALPLAEKPGRTVHLTYLRLQSTFLQTFLSCDVSFPALKRIKVDLYFHRHSRGVDPVNVWPPNITTVDFRGLFRPEHKSASTFDGTENPYTVSCPGLDSLTLFAVDDRVGVRAQEVAFLGRALGQLHRADHCKASLCLVGVDFADSEELALIEQTFSAVLQLEFAGRGSLEGLDDGLWNAAYSSFCVHSF